MQLILKREEIGCQGLADDWMLLASVLNAGHHIYTQSPIQSLYLDSNRFIYLLFSYYLLHQDMLHYVFFSFLSCFSLFCVQ